MSMLKLLQLLERPLKEKLPQLDKYRPISKIADLEPASDGSRGFNGYAICSEIVRDRKYKGRKGKNETSIFLNCYSNVSNNPDLAALWFMGEVKKALDEVDLSDPSLGIKTYKVEYADSIPRAEFNERLQAWQGVITILIRWEET